MQSTYSATGFRLVILHEGYVTYIFTETRLTSKELDIIIFLKQLYCKAITNFENNFIIKTQLNYVECRF